MSLLSAIVYLLLPPTGLAWVALLILLLPRRFRPRTLAVLLLIPLVLLSMPVVSVWLLGSLGVPAPAPGPIPGAIVILSAEVEQTAVPGALEVGPLTLERERAGAALQRTTGLPILVTGGILSAPPAVAVLMARSLPGDFGVPVRWVEARSTTTWENAEFSAPMLKAAGIQRVFLVTHAWHMRRSMLAFQRAGIDAVPAPVRSLPPASAGLQDFEPTIGSWARSYYAIHEWIGLLFYTWRR